MKGDEVHSAQFFEGKEECFINYSLTVLWELIDNIRLRCSAYERSQREQPNNKRQAKNEIKIEIEL